MGEILGIGVTHYPGLIQPDEQMAGLLNRTLNSDQVPEKLKDPKTWPAAMREEWKDPVASATEHRRRLVNGFREAREAIDAFKPDFVVIFGDDQYENFREEGVPSFCVFLQEETESHPFARYFMGNTNVWGEGKDTVIKTKGHKTGASYLAAKLIEEDYDVSYAYKMRYENGLPHAFINTVMYLDYDRKGFPYPVVPFHVNCYGSSVIAKRGLDRASDRRGGSQSGRSAGAEPAALLRHRRGDRAHHRRQPVAGRARRFVVVVARVSDAEEPLPLSRQCRRPGAVRRTCRRAS